MEKASLFSVWKGRIYFEDCDSLSSPHKLALKYFHQHGKAQKTACHKNQNMLRNSINKLISEIPIHEIREFCKLSSVFVFLFVCLLACLLACLLVCFVFSLFSFYLSYLGIHTLERISQLLQFWIQASPAAETRCKKNISSFPD